MRARREPKYNVKKGIPKKPQHVYFHVFAQTTHVVAAPHGFACVVIPATRLYIPSFIEIRSGVSEPRGGQNLAFPITLASRFYNSLYYRTSRENYQHSASNTRILFGFYCESLGTDVSHYYYDSIIVFITQKCSRHNTHNT